jgi:hypothetical protein
MVYLYVTMMAILLFPAFFVNMQPFTYGTTLWFIWGSTLFALGTASAGVFYVASQRAQKRSVIWTILQLPILMSIGIGIALNNSRGVIEALLGHESPFIRTPKYNDTKSRSVLPTPSIKLWMSLLEILLGIYTLNCAIIAIVKNSTLISIPFLLLFSAGYLYVGITSLRSLWHVNRTAPIIPA